MEQDDRREPVAQFLARHWGMEAEYDGRVTGTPYDRDYWLHLTDGVLQIADDVAAARST